MSKKEEIVKEASFKSVSDGESKRDFVSFKNRELIQGVDEFESLITAIRETDAIIKFREVQIKGNDCIEEFNGARMPLDMLKAFYATNIRTYNNYLRRLNLLKSKLVLDGLTTGDVDDIARGKFDINKLAGLARRDKVDYVH